MSTVMNLVFITHPEWLALRSQNQFAQMLFDGCQRLGHDVQLRRPQAVLHRPGWRAGWAKWAGYADQYVFFPHQFRARLKTDPPHTLYVFCDQALGPWVPLAAHRPHVVHCHDFLALGSALGEAPQQRTRASGRLLQRYIRRGWQRGKNFISVSEHTRHELHRLGGVRPRISEVVPNGLSAPFARQAPATARQHLLASGWPDLDSLLLHVGGDSWYKNRAGVLHLYAQYAHACAALGQAVLPLCMVGPPLSPALSALVAALPAGAPVRLLQSVTPDTLTALYSLAALLIFPSHAEGFGWPIAEALACGCPVLTTAGAPMTEVGGEQAHYLPALAPGADVQAWAQHGAQAMLRILARGPAQRRADADAAIAWAQRFDASRALAAVLAVYQRVVAAA